MKGNMKYYISYCMKFIGNLEVVLKTRHPLCWIQEFPNSHLLSDAEIRDSYNICWCCRNVLKWLSKINLEKQAESLGIEDFYEFRENLCELNELLTFVLQYYSMVRSDKIGTEDRTTLERINDRFVFIESFRDMKLDFGSKSDESVLDKPVKEINSCNLYIEVGKNVVVGKGLANSSIRDTKEYKEFVADKNRDNLITLLNTGEVETLFDGCIPVEDYELYSEIAECDVKLRGNEAHYVSWKMVLNKSKYDKICATADSGTFLLIYSNIDLVDDEIMCEWNGMDIELSSKRVLRFAGIYKGIGKDRRGTYNFIVDTNAY